MKRVKLQRVTIPNLCCMVNPGTELSATYHACGNCGLKLKVDWSKEAAGL